MTVSREELEERFRKIHNTTKREILNSVKKDHEKIMENAKKDQRHSMAYYQTLDKIYCKFEKKIEETILFKNVEIGWYYNYMIDYSGAKLYLCHDEIWGEDEEGHILSENNQDFMLIEVNTKMLSVEQYAELQGVGQGTVRQWIRRGKIRNASKYGNEWKIPELTDVPKRGYTDACYSWNEELEGLPEEYVFLNQYRGVFITQSEDDKSLFYAIFLEEDNDGNGKRIECDNKQKEKMEMFMIAHPQIKYVSNIWEGIVVDLLNVYRSEE